MDNDNPKAIFEAMKAKADAAYDEKRIKREQTRRFMYLRFAAQKEGAAVDHALRVLESRDLKQLTTTDNRPAEKVVKRRTKGIKPSSGRSM